MNSQVLKTLLECYYWTKLGEGLNPGKRENEALNQMPRSRFDGPPRFHHPPGQPPRQDFTDHYTKYDI